MATVSLLASLLATVAAAPAAAGTISSIAPDRYFSPDGDGQEDAIDVQYDLASPAHVYVFVRDAAGNRVRVIEAGTSHGSGGWSFHWDGRDDGGEVVSDGVYAYTLTAQPAIGDQDVATGSIGVDTRLPVRVVTPVSGDDVGATATVRVEPAAGIQLQWMYVSPGWCREYPACYSFDFASNPDGSLTTEASTDTWFAGENDVRAVVGYVDQFGREHSYNAVPVPVHVSRSVEIVDVSPDRYFTPDGDGQEDSTYVSFRLTADAATTITIADAGGDVVRTIETATSRGQGSDSFNWDGRDDDGQVVPDGVYRYTLAASGEAGAQDSATGRIGVDTRQPAQIAAPASGATLGETVAVRVQPASGFTLNGVNVQAANCTFYPCAASGSSLDPDGAITVETSTDSWMAGPNLIYVYVGWVDPFGETHGYTTPSLAVTVSRSVEIVDVSSDRYFSPDGDGQDDETYVYFSLTANAETTITIADAGGDVVRTIETANPRVQLGQGFTWDGRDDDGQPLPDGVYAYTVTAQAGGDGDVARGRIGIDRRQPAQVVTPVADDEVGDTVAVQVEPASGLSLSYLFADPVTCVYWGSCGVFRSEVEADGSIALVMPTDLWLAGANALRIGVGYLDQFGEPHNWSPAVVPVTVPRAVRIVNVDPDRYFSPDGDGQDDETYVNFSLTADAATTITIADAGGDVVRTIETANPRLQFYSQSFSWDGRDDDGQAVPDGVYTYTITAVGLLGAQDVVTGRLGVDPHPPGEVTVPRGGDTLASIAQFAYAPRAGTTTRAVLFCVSSLVYDPCSSVYEPSDDGSWRTSRDTLEIPDGPLTVTASVTYDDAFGVAHGWSTSIATTVDNTTPSVDLATAPASGVAPLVSTVRISAYQPRGAQLDYELDFGDGSTHAAGTIAPPYDPVDVPHTFAAAGTYDVRVSVGDGDGHVAERSTQVRVEAAGDHTPPVATILDGPTGPTGSASATFSFKSNEAGSDFACALDDAAPAPCTSPAAYSGLGEGEHTFRVHATDAAGNVGTAVRRAFTVDTIAPETTLDGGPEGSTTDHAPAFDFSSDEPGTFRCALDGGLPELCASGHAYPLIVDGPHTFSVYAVDAADNADPTPATRAFTVESLPPLNTPPTARLALDVTAGAAPLVVHASVVGADGDDDPLTYSLSFGDGTPPVTGALSDDPVALDHTYARAGSFLVRLVVGDGTDEAERTTTVTTALPEPLTAAAGDDQHVAVAQQVTFDGGGSRPGALTDGYRWEFGDGAGADGAQATHAYDAPGTYTATLTTTSGGDSATDTATVVVDPPAPPDGLAIHVTGGGSPLPGAQATIVAPDGSRRSATADGGGTALFGGLPDGPVTVYVWASGYRPKAVTATVADGRGTADAALEAGEPGAATLDSHRMTLDEILAAGIDVADPENSHVYEANIHLFFVPDEPEERHVVHVYVTPDGVLCASDCDGQSGGGGGGGDLVPCLGPLADQSCFGVGEYQYLPTVTYVAGEPIIQWLVLPMRASFLKEFFEVKLIVQNLTDGFTFSPGVASLQLPAGLSLAPRPTPQTALQQVGSVPGGTSRTTSWLVRGDVEGDYDLTADYSATVQPIDQPVYLAASTQAPVRVWGASALRTTIRVDERAVRWAPYGFDVEVRNVSDVPVYNMQVEMLDRRPDRPNSEALFFYAPSPPQVQGTAAIPPRGDPRDTWTAHYVVYPGLGNEEVTRLRVVLAQSFVERTGGDVDLAPELALRDGPSLGPGAGPVDVEVRPDGAGHDEAVLMWQRPEPPSGLSVTGYELWTRQALKGGSWRRYRDDVGTAVLGQEEMTIPARDRAEGRYYAVGTKYSDGSVQFQHQIGVGPSRYVSIGDSFSAGEGVPTFEPGTDTETNTCHRSFGAYGRLLVADEDVPANLSPSTFRACSGAIAQDVHEGQPGRQGQRKQLDYVNEFTDVISLSMGGNDVGFADIARLCALFDCSGVDDGLGPVGTDEWLKDVSKMWEETSFLAPRLRALGDTALTCVSPVNPIARMMCAYKLYRSIRTAKELAAHDLDRVAEPKNFTHAVLRNRLLNAYRAIAAKAPNAHVFVQLYPLLVEPAGTDGPVPTCNLAPLGGALPDLPFFLTDREREAMVNVIRRLNIDIRAAIDSANAGPGPDRFEWVDPSDEFAGHELCENGSLSSRSYFNAVVNPYLSAPGNYGDIVYSFHPNEFGQQAYERALANQIRQDVEANVVHVQPRALHDAGTVFVPFGARTLHAMSGWRGSTVTMTLVSPSGIPYEAGTPGARSGGDATSQWLEVEDPAPGSWQVRVFGDDVPDDGELAQVTAFADMTSPEPPPADSQGAPVDGQPDAYDLTADGPAGATFVWTFSDGGSAEGAQVRHTFTNPGRRWATVRVTAPTGESTWSSVDFGGAADETPPVLVGVPVDRTVEATGASGAAVGFALPTAEDEADGAVDVVCAPPPGSTFPLGVTTVDCSAGDAAGNHADASFTVTVRDTTPPLIAGVPADVAATTTDQGAPVQYGAPIATDLVDGAVPVACDPPSGATFALGTTTVRCRSVDAAGNEAAATFVVTVTRRAAPPVVRPQLVLPGPLRVEATSAAGAIVRYRVSASEPGHPGRIHIVCSRRSGTRFPLGATTVTCTATDRRGVTSSGAFVVTVSDTVAPVLSRLPRNLDADATGPVGAIVDYSRPRPRAWDKVDGGVAVSCSPASRTRFEIGRTTVTCSAADRAGNRVRGTFNVVVHGAHDQLGDLTQDVRRATGHRRAARIRSDLLELLARADAHLEDTSSRVTCDRLADFVARVAANSGPRGPIRWRDGRDLTDDARRIRAVVGCRP